MPKITILEGNNDDKDKVRVFMVKGEKGDTGDTGIGIESVEKTSTVGNIDTYTITFTNGATYDFNVANGDGATIVVDNLTDTSSVKALSANQGYILKGLVDSLDTDKVEISDIIDNLTSTATNKPLSANQGKELKDLIDNIQSSIITNLEADLILEDGTEPTLEEGYYYTNGYDVIVNGDTDVYFENAICYYRTNRLSVVFSDYLNNKVGINEHSLSYLSTSTQKWLTVNVQTVTEIPQHCYDNQIPTTKAIMDFLTDTSRYRVSLSDTTWTGNGTQAINMDFPSDFEFSSMFVYDLMGSFFFVSHTGEYINFQSGGNISQSSVVLTEDEGTGYFRITIPANDNLNISGHNYRATILGKRSGLIS